MFAYHVVNYHVLYGSYCGCKWVLKYTRVHVHIHYIIYGCVLCISVYTLYIFLTARRVNLLLYVRGTLKIVIVYRMYIDVHIQFLIYPNCIHFYSGSPTRGTAGSTAVKLVREPLKIRGPGDSLKMRGTRNLQTLKHRPKHVSLNAL
jgi:hypothetical protein